MSDPLDDLDDILSSPVSRPRTSYLTSAAPRPSTGPPRARPEVTGGWGEAAPGSPAPHPGPPTGRRQRSNFTDTGVKRLELSPPAPRTSTWDDDDTAVIPMIPDLEDVQDEDLAMQVASAPLSRVNRVATIQELNDELGKHPTFMSLENIDLQLLTKRLSEPADLQEPDRPWMWDVLFTEVLTDIQDGEELTDELIGELPMPKPSAAQGGRRGTSGRVSRPVTLSSNDVRNM